MNEFFISAKDGFRISLALFDLDRPKGLIQIIHGSVEHKERYYGFCRFLNEQGYAVILSDNRGHGASVDNRFPLGYMDGYELIIEDLYEVSQYICLLHPMKPLYLFGHSLGSVFARCYIEKHDDQIEKLILSGTVHYNPFLPLGIFLTHLAISISGSHGYNAFLRHFIMNGSDVSWISANQVNISAYKADPLCGFKYCNQSVLTVMESVKELKAYNHYLCNNPDLPVLCISGEHDPVAGGIRGTTESLNMLRKIGYHNFENIIYPGMKHEVLNEKGHMKVYRDILDFIEN
ncbi:MAG: alpha/beta hydrolase [Bacteroidales bacterium]